MKFLISCLELRPSFLNLKFLNRPAGCTLAVAIAVRQFACECGSRRVTKEIQPARRGSRFWTSSRVGIVSPFRAVRPETGVSRGHDCVRRGQLCGKSLWTRPEGVSGALCAPFCPEV